MNERPVVTVGAVIERADRKILLVRTHKWKGTLGVPGGKIERGETQAAALCREMREETGLSVHDIRFVIAQDAIDLPEFYRPLHMLLLNYSCRTDDTRVTLNEEAEEFMWLTPSEALARDLNGPTRTLIEVWLEQRAARQATPPSGSQA